MTLSSPVAPGSRPRRHTYSADFKASVVAACRQPGVSMAAIALAHQLDANVLRRWVKQQEARSVAPASAARPPALVPVAVRDVPEADAIRCEIRHRQAVIQVTWPVSQAAACAQWLRELLP